MSFVPPSFSETVPQKIEQLSTVGEYIREISQYLNGSSPDTLKAQLDALEEKLAEVETASKADNSIQATIPSGTLIHFAGTAAPIGWLICDGLQAYSKSTYSVLAGLFPNNSLPGDSSNTFRLPDLRGRILGGYPTNDAQSLRIPASAIPFHTHGVGVLDKGKYESFANYPNSAWSLVTTGNASHSDLRAYLLVESLLSSTRGYLASQTSLSTGERTDYVNIYSGAPYPDYLDWLSYPRPLSTLTSRSLYVMGQTWLGAGYCSGNAVAQRPEKQNNLGPSTITSGLTSSAVSWSDPSYPKSESVNTYPPCQAVGCILIKT